MKNLFTSVKKWFAGLWIVMVYDIKLLAKLIYSTAAFIFCSVLLYLFIQLLVTGNVWQSIASFCIGAIVAALLVSIASISKAADDKMYELAIVDLQKQLKEEQENYNLMRMANLSFQQDKDKQAARIANMTAKYSALYLECKKLKEEKEHNNFGTSKVNDKGKIVE